MAFLKSCAWVAAALSEITAALNSSLTFWVVKAKFLFTNELRSDAVPSRYRAPIPSERVFDNASNKLGSLPKAETAGKPKNSPKVHQYPNKANIASGCALQ